MSAATPGRVQKTLLPSRSHAQNAKHPAISASAAAPQISRVGRATGIYQPPPPPPPPPPPENPPPLVPDELDAWGCEAIMAALNPVATPPMVLAKLPAEKLPPLYQCGE